MKVVILTSSLYGTAACLLPSIMQSKSCDVVMVICSQGYIADKRKYYWKKLAKIGKIGLLGALNGVRMRKWFNEDVHRYIQLENLEQLCLQHNIPFFTVPSINSHQTLALFQKANADLGLSLGNGYIGKKIFSIPSYGMLNIHHEVLPNYQNAQSIIWQIYNGSDTTGYTIHKIDEHIDTGEIIYQEKIPIVFRESFSDTVAYNSFRLLSASAQGIIHVLKNFSELYPKSQKQGFGEKYTTPTILQYVRMYRNYRKLKHNNR